MNKNPRLQKVLARFVPGRRKSLRDLAIGTGAFVAPVIASFSLQGLGGVAQAQACSPNQPQGCAPTPALSPTGLVLTAGLVAGAAAVTLRRNRSRK